MLEQVENNFHSYDNLLQWQIFRLSPHKGNTHSHCTN